MKIQIDVEIPSIPSFIKVGNDSRSIKDFSEEELRQIGIEWTDKLVERSKILNSAISK